MDLSFYKNKRVFITGHTGFKGTWLCRVLLLADADITGYALEAPTEPSLFKMTKTESGIKSIIGDVRDREKLCQAMKEAKPQIVFHLAAQPIVLESYKNPAATYETNVMGTVNVLEAARACPSIKSLVNVTTDKVYKNNEWIWGYREDEALCGYDPYSNSKSCSELVTQCYKNCFFNEEKSPAISTARSGNVIGGGDYSAERIIPDCVRAAQAGKRIEVRNPNSTRPYQHVLECLCGYLTLAQMQCQDKALAGSYNFGPDEESCVTTGQLAELFCGLWGEGASWKDASKKNAPREASFLKLQCEKAKSALGWKPRWTIRQAVEKTVEWQKRVAAGKDAAAVTDEQIKEYFGGLNV